MRRRLLQVGILWRPLIALILALCLIPVGSHPVAALSAEDVFDITYEISLSKTEINGSEIFYVTIQGEAKCKEDLEFPYNLVTKAEITSHIVAIHNGTEKPLSDSYTVIIDPFPQEEGETFEITEMVIALRFPAGSESGTYDVVGELIEAKVHAIVWQDVTSYLPPSQAISSVTYVALDGGGGGGGGGIIVEPDNGLLNYIDEDGVFTDDVTIESEDGDCWVTIDEDTTGLTEDGDPLSEISVAQIEEPPPLPEDSPVSVIGLAYDIEPDGATFSPPITLAFTYDDSLVPEGVAEANLVIAIWDEEAGEWIDLDCTVDADDNTITAEVSHLTTFAVLAYAYPAAFVASNLSITPDEVDIGQEIAISVRITNTGSLEGTYQVVLILDDQVEATQDITLAGGARITITFKISEDAADTYSVSIGDLSGSFVVKPAAVSEPAPASTSEPASESEPEPEPEPAPAPTHPSSPAQPVNWTVLGGVIAAVVASGLLIFLLARRKPS